METLLAPGGIVTLLVAMWVDTRRRTNGSGPLAGKIDDLSTAVHRVEAKLDDHLRDHP